MSEEFLNKPDLGEYNPNQFFDLATAPFDVNEHCLYSVYSGSIAYGTNLPTSDLDIRGVVCPPLKFFTGLSNFEQVENQSKDVCFFGLKKFFQLAYKNNVHALELLYMDHNFINILKYPFDLVLKNRNVFLSKNIGYSFGGYAFQQLKILKTKTSNHTGRIGLAEKYGYDTKFAMHCIILYRSGSEALLTGKLNVYRPDLEELKEIRLGKYSYEEFVKWEMMKLLVALF